ncbi:MAG: dehydrogenase [Thermoleophilia bacterium]|nr:dehydrogenase [Thermoleophilia bacterium]
MSEESRPVGLAIIGAGLMGSQHATSASACPEITLVGIHAAESTQSKALAEHHGCHQFGSVADVLRDDRVEAVLVATPTDTHDELAALAMASGKHAFVEKPVTRTLDDALVLRSVARSTGRVLGVGHVIRYFAEYRAIHAAVTGGDIGTPAVATFGRRCQQPDWSPDGWHTDMARSGGVAVDMLVHDVDLARWCFGEPTAVHARVVGSDRHGGLDYALATLVYEDGPIVHLHGSWAEPEGFSQSAEVCGSTGMVSYDSRGRDELVVTPHASNTGVTALPPPPAGREDPFQSQLRDFAGAIRGGPAMPSDIDWAIGSLRIALAMLESSDTRDVVELEPLGALFDREAAASLVAAGATKGAVR